MISTNLPFLENELSDVARLFPEAEIVHAMTYRDGTFYNSVSLDGGDAVLTADVHPCEGELAYKRYGRRYAKLALYRALSAKTGLTLPWGALTGIRPTKLAYGEKAEGRPFEPLFRAMGVSEEKISLTAAVLAGQAEIYAANRGGCDLFVGIPFCPSKCAYCSFITADIRYTAQYLDAYLDALLAELRFAPRSNVKSVYVGGGTPLVLDPARLSRLLKGIAALDLACEYTVEAGRPDVFTAEKLDLLQAFGVNRICINAQSFSDETLRTIGRNHTARDVFRAFELAAKYDFTINLDLIAGLEGEKEADFAHSLSAALSCAPDNITVHTLCLKRGAKLKEEVDRLDGTEVGKMLACSRAVLSEAGYAPYYLYRQKYMAGNFENVGWTKPGKACAYNVDVMEEITDNVAFGANAISKRVLPGGRIERYASPKDIPTYLEKIDTILAKKKELFGAI